MCSQQWVREKFLKRPEHLLKDKMLLDKAISHKQVRFQFNLPSTPTESVVEVWSIFRHSS